MSSPSKMYQSRRNVAKERKAKLPSKNLTLNLSDLEKIWEIISNSVVIEPEP